MMDRNRVNTDMKKLVVGILAHVDSGKTTLSEAMLYTAGKIRKLGRVDHKDAYLDTDAQERERGITIFSKQAVFTYDGMEITLLLSKSTWLKIGAPYRFYFQKGTRSTVGNDYLDAALLTNSFLGYEAISEPGEHPNPSSES